MRTSLFTCLLCYVYEMRASLERKMIICALLLTLNAKRTLCEEKEKKAAYWNRLGFFSSRLCLSLEKNCFKSIQLESTYVVNSAKNSS